MYHKEVVHLQFHLIIINSVFLPSVNHEDNGEEAGHGAWQCDVIQHLTTCREASYRRAENAVNLILLRELFKVIDMRLGHRLYVVLIRKDKHFFVKYQRKCE